MRLWSRLPGLADLAAGFRKPRIATPDSLAQFMAEQSAFVAQKCTIDSCQARSGLMWPQLEKEQADVTRLLDYARAQPQRIGPELRQKAERTAASLAQEMAEANAAQEVFNTQLKLAEGAACIVGQKVYGGSKVRVGDQLSEIEDERGGGVYRLAEGP